MSLKTLVISEERARKVRPILKWIKEGAPRKRERDEAAGALRALEGITGTKQISVTRGQEDMILFVFDTFPETTFAATQLSMFSPTEEFNLTHPTTGKVRPIKRLIDELNIPKHEGLKRPVLKKEFTEEDRLERKSIGLSEVPQDKPTDALGIELSSRIEEAQSRLHKRDKEFGKRR